MQLLPRLLPPLRSSAPLKKARVMHSNVITFLVFMKSNFLKLIDLNIAQNANKSSDNPLLVSKF